MTDTSLPPVLSLRDVELTLMAASGPVHILDHVSLEVAAGESVAIVGPSGSGKSSLMAVAAGLERATSGDILLLGDPVNGRSEGQLARLRRGRVGFVFQSFHLMPTMTALENVMAPLEIARQDRVRERAIEALALVGLEHRLTHYPGQLSGGERQRVAVARALAVGPEIIFADEPTGNLDTAAGGMIADFLFDAARQHGAALVLVTHDRELASRADRTIEMRDGAILS
ncbi:ABC transporter ATP-binding protein [Maricaulis sp.]|uniref:ABC transporter ATP-binding protein n=1 Tax=Maricaulis sp. TaxID=1486257 RepID=UPI003A911A90